MAFNETINETDLAFIAEDLAVGDYVYVTLLINKDIFGTLEKYEADEVSLRVPLGHLMTFNATSKPNLSYVMKNIGKPPNMFDLKPGVIISRPAVDNKGQWFREYAKVLRAEYGRGISPYLIEIEYLNKEASKTDKAIYQVQYQFPLESQMKTWEIEA